MDTNIRNIKCVSVFLWLHLLSNTQTTFEAQFMKKLSDTEAELKKSVAFKKKRVIDFITGVFITVSQRITENLYSSIWCT